MLKCDFKIYRFRKVKDKNSEFQGLICFFVVLEWVLLNEKLHNNKIFEKFNNCSRMEIPRCKKFIGVDTIWFSPLNEFKPG